MGGRYLGNLREAQGAFGSSGGALGSFGMHTPFEPPLRTL